MELTSLGFHILSGFSFLLLLIGLYKPWIVLWWEDTSYRLKVIRLYGSVALGALIAGQILRYFS